MRGQGQGRTRALGSQSENVCLPDWIRADDDMGEGTRVGRDDEMKGGKGEKNKGKSDKHRYRNEQSEGGQRLLHLVRSAAESPVFSRCFDRGTERDRRKERSNQRIGYLDDILDQVSRQNDRVPPSGADE